VNPVTPDSGHGSPGDGYPGVQSPGDGYPGVQSPGDGFAGSRSLGNGSSGAPKSVPGDDFVSRVLAVVESIPAGRVMTYGDVAAALGSRASRAVGQTMAYYGSDVPWWRVIRASGHPAIDHESRALEHFRAEGTPLKWSPSGTFRVDLAAARHSVDDVADVADEPTT
jgi:alkylated DNA nucleotide flippase Atl1